MGGVEKVFWSPFMSELFVYCIHHQVNIIEVNQLLLKRLEFFIQISKDLIKKESSRPGSQVNNEFEPKHLLLTVTFGILSGFHSPHSQPAAMTE